MCPGPVTHTARLQGIPAKEARPTNLPVWPFVGEHEDTSDSVVLVVACPSRREPPSQDEPYWSVSDGL